MWFNNVIIYQCEHPSPDSLQVLLEDKRLKPCPAHARFNLGWLPTSPSELIRIVAGSSLICFGKEERILPRGVIQRLLAEQVEAREAQRGYPMKRAERAQLAEELEFDLLPKAFCIQKRLPVILDTMSHRLYMNTSSANQASQVIALLRQSIPDLTLEPLASVPTIQEYFTRWVKTPETLPPAFQLGSHCLLVSLENEKKRVQCKGYELPAEEVTSLLNQGFFVSELSLVWQERIEFTLTPELTFKRVKCLDYLVDEFNDINQQETEDEQENAALILLTGELRAVLNDVLKATL
ncbi:MAG: recombination-associated protein RdgC [Legionellaceae bacterium]